MLDIDVGTRYVYENKGKATKCTVKKSDFSTRISGNLQDIDGTLSQKRTDGTINPKDSEK